MHPVTAVVDTPPAGEHTETIAGYDPAVAYPSPLNLDAVKKAIRYPEAAESAGVQGRVIFRVLIDEHGHYADHKVLKSPHPSLAEACEGPLRELRCIPAKKNGQAVRAWLTVPFSFELPQATDEE